MINFTKYNFIKGLFLLSTILILSGTSSIVNGGVYYVRADGTALTKEMASGPSRNRNKCMDMIAFNRERFFPGDTIYFSGLGGVFQSESVDLGFFSVMHLPSSGTFAEPILYSGIYGETPLIDASKSVSSSTAILIHDKDFINVTNFDIKGSGGSSAFHVLGRSGVSGYGVKVKNINVLSAYGSSMGSHDCFALSDYAQVEFFSITATKCRPEFPPFTGSHQAITGHGNSKYIVNSAVFTDSNYIVVNTLNTTAYLNNITASKFYVYGFANGKDATDESSTVIDNSDIYIDSGAPLFANSSLVSKKAALEFRNSNIYSSNSRYALINADVHFIRNNIFIDDPNWAYNSIGGDVYLENNNIQIFNIGGPLFQTDASNSGKLFIRNNVFKLGGLTGDVLIRYRNADNSGNINHNIFEEFSNVSQLVNIDSGAAVPLIYNNLFYNKIVGGTVMELKNDSVNNIAINIEVFNNIFYNTETIIKNNGYLIAGVNNNNYFGGEIFSDSNAIIGNPDLYDPGVDFNLNISSPLIDRGVYVNVEMDMIGNPIQDIIDIGPLEYQPDRLRSGTIILNDRNAGSINIVFFFIMALLQTIMYIHRFKNNQR